MAYYKAGDIIRLTRQFFEISQEELCFEICSPHTLSRIETGKTSVKLETYHRLMDKMNRYGGKNYAICTSEEMEILQERVLLENAIIKSEYDLAEKYLEEIKKKISNNIMNIQYVRRMDAIIRFSKNEIEVKFLIEELEDTLSMTITNYEKYFNSIYPYTEEELYLLMNIANRYDEIHNIAKSITIYNMLLKNIENDHIKGKKISYLKLLIMRNLASLYGNIGEYERSTIIAEEALEIAIEEDYGYLISILLEDIAWNMRKTNQERGKVKNIMRQAYFIAAARCDKKTKDIIENAFMNAFGEKLCNI